VLHKFKTRTMNQIIRKKESLDTSRMSAATEPEIDRR